MQAWQCEFEKPTVKDLIGALSPEAGALYTELRRAVLKQIKKKPKLEWTGLTWCWCECTHIENGGMLSTIYLVSDPENPRVALALSTTFFDSHPPQTLPKVLHCGFERATCVGHLTWCEWTINSEDLVMGVLELIALAYGPSQEKSAGRKYGRS